MKFYNLVEVGLWNKNSVVLCSSGASDEIVGYLNRQVAEDTILPNLKKGLRFKCIAASLPYVEEHLPINTSVLSQVET